MRRPTAAVMVLLLLTATPAAAGPLEIKAAAASLRQACRQADMSRPHALLTRRLWQWVETELTSVPAEPDLAALTRRLNDAIAGAPADASCAQAPGESDDFGRITIALDRQGGTLQVRTKIGVSCGDSQSAALFHWRGQHWRRFWRDDGTGAPMPLAAVLHGADAPLVLSLRRGEWCTSSWHPVQLRLWRAGPDRPQALLLEQNDFAFLSDVDGPLAARLDGADAYAEFMVASLDMGVHSRLTTRHYRVEGERVRRLDPIALTPANFIEEWLSQPWRHSIAWTDPAGRQAARRWHAAMRDRNGAASTSGEFTGNALRCRHDASLWQVGMDFADMPARQRHVAFLVRWTEPYRFRLVAISRKPWPGCTDDADPTGRDRRLLGGAAGQ